MKKIVAVLAAASFALAVPAFAMDHDHGSMNMDHGGKATDHTAHREVVDGVRVAFEVFPLSGGKDTHHIMVSFTDAASGKPLTSGEVKMKVQGPDKGEQIKDPMKMGEGFGANFSLPKPGKYGVMAKFKLADGKVRASKFWYTVK